MLGRAYFYQNSPCKFLNLSSEHYPFGMVMPGKRLKAGFDGSDPSHYVDAHGGSYRYRFQGLEDDPEIKGEGNWCAFGNYGYDSRAVYRASRDPKWTEYPGQSPYSVFNGNPILYNDPTGESGIVTIDKEKKTITIESHIVLYGNANSMIAEMSVTNLSDQLNSSNLSTMLDGVSYEVKFKITGEYRENISFSEIASNTDLKNNYYRVESDVETRGSKTHKPLADDLRDDPGGNTGLLKLSHINYPGATTLTHELLHGYGAVKMGDGGDGSGHLKSQDWTGKGVPPMILSRGAKVDSEYRYDSNDPTSTLNPDKRRVQQYDIDLLHLDDIDFNSKSQFGLGKLSGVVEFEGNTFDPNGGKHSGKGKEKYEKYTENP